MCGKEEWSHCLLTNGFPVVATKGWMWLSAVLLGFNGKKLAVQIVTIFFFFVIAQETWKGSENRSILTTEKKGLKVASMGCDHAHARTWQWLFWFWFLRKLQGTSIISSYLKCLSRTQSYLGVKQILHLKVLTCVMSNALEDDSNGLTQWIYFVIFVGLLIFASFSLLIKICMFFVYL